MSGIIQILPEAIANQIAAGEVVQRPASVVKELLENALDAGATDVQLYIQHAGKSLIQVIDNGKGMNEHDARLCFARHATSKIRTAQDLYALRTFGFRGEAMASIAAVAQVVLRTRQQADEVGTEVQIEANTLTAQAPCATPVGTAISVRNLFFNTPARRNFLKGNPVETRHILTELYRAALSRPDVRFRFGHNGELLHDWPATPDARQRFVQLHPFLTTADLLAVDEKTEALHVHGWLGAPHTARKQRGEQYFVVNGRYVRDNLLHHAVAQVFEPLVATGTHPVYLLYINLDPARVDINIHPTKTEIKFDNERLVYQVLHSAVRHAIGLLHQVPSVAPVSAFEQELYRQPQAGPGGVPLPLAADPTETLTLQEFRRQRQADTDARNSGHRTNTGRLPSYSPPPRPQDWQALYGALNLPLPPPADAPAAEPPRPATPLFAPQPGGQAPVWVLGRWWVQPTAEGLLLVDPRAAARRLRYEAALRTAQASVQQPSHRLLYPIALKLSAPDMATLRAELPLLRQLGFDIQVLSAAEVLVLGLPLPLGNGKANALVDELAALLSAPDAQAALHQRMATLLAAHTPAESLAGASPAERAALVADLLACPEPRYAPDGAPASVIIGPDQLGAFLQ